MRGKQLHGESNTYIFVVDQFHQFEFSICTFSMSYILKWSGKLLNSYLLICFCIQGSTVGEYEKKERDN